MVQGENGLWQGQIEFLFVGNYTSSKNMFSETLQSAIESQQESQKNGYLPPFFSILRGSSY